ncbi:hypothetical protein T552_02010 [Pneumocystis carinii B80]|uniref:ISWI chromatin-remodeling complex ATPase ISW2 n=1 Tax=Pneumocystis carinii (strain B80) TaxID=1408658 RepID=A0A0W4ZIF4_PNEC8|nr:hypothetical protein T552_02010 [Pneumocystis carinii B80]KTW28151.1 hypothetical protein T552_02010 [Pneumocystis carinii B80]
MSENNENQSTSELSGEFEEQNVKFEEELMEEEKLSQRNYRTMMNMERQREFGEKHAKLNEAKAVDSTKRFSFLLGQTELFRHFINLQTGANADSKEIINKLSNEKPKKEMNSKDHRHRKTEQEEDAELLQEEDPNEGNQTIFTESPPYIIGGKMRDYQVQGLNWLISLYENGINGILADEMGLGKTLQTISFLGYLRFLKGIRGPHLVAAPKSTLDNWSREFSRWIPEINVFVFQAPKDKRAVLINERLLTNNFDVCITSYETILREKMHFKKFAWEYIIVDEAHRIKNEESMLSKIIRLLNSRNRLLITGTPLQNNLHELWALLNFLLPDIFADSQVFDRWFESQNGDSDTVIKQLHKVLRPFLLRRVKSDVERTLKPKKETNLYVGLSEMQVKWYQKILEKDIDAVNGAIGKKEGKTRLLNIVMQLRKCCNHPYLFDGAEPGPPYTTDEHIVTNSGKMVMLDKLLRWSKAQDSRVLIFSQMGRVLDILEDYCYLRGYKYCRIDGQTSHEDRIVAIDDFNAPGSDKFLFLLTTRAGGLGINLTTADIVVIYDSDWNPQADLQAMDRAHRIGQTKQVYVFRFVTDNTVEEKVLERAAQKLRLDQLVIQQGRTQLQNKNSASKEELITMIQHGAEDVFKQKEGGTMTEDDIEEIMKKGEKRTAELNKRYESLGIDDLQKFSTDSAYEWNGEDYTKKRSTDGAGIKWIYPSKRERTQQSYSLDQYYKGVLKTGGRTHGPPKAPRPPKQINIQDHQFFPQRLIDLQDRETAYFRKEIGYKIPLADGTPEDLEERKAVRDMEQREIDNAVPLTEEEQLEKEKLLLHGFGDWQRRDFYHFIQACAKHGRNSFKAIAQEIEGKTLAQIKEYSKVFWERYSEIDGYERYIGQIEAGEGRIQKQDRQTKLLHEKISQYRAPLQQLKIMYNQNKGKSYTEEEDRFLLVKLNEYGLGTEDVYERLREEIRISPLFRFDWFFKSRTALELQRRCATLLTSVKRELEMNEEKTDWKRDRSDDNDDEYEEDDIPRKKTRTSVKDKRTRSRLKNKHSSERDHSYISTTRISRSRSKK